jgi:hypothetical protein
MQQAHLAFRPFLTVLAWPLAVGKLRARGEDLGEHTGLGVSSFCVQSKLNVRCSWAKKEKSYDLATRLRHYLVIITSNTFTAS